ncbi:proline dehydrogenase family protein [Rhodococcus triatomae]|nr:proline dehydrogenase [Rhodococcus triatomae BKS 15-14]
MANPLRPAILAAARSPRVKSVITHAPGTRSLVTRFVAGEARADALIATRALLDSGRSVSLDHLGEDTTDIEQAKVIVAEYRSLLGDLGEMPEAGGVGIRRLEVSVKLSALGQSLPKDGEKIALDHARELCEAAQSAGVWLSVDAEDHTTTDSTLSIVAALRTDFPWVGAVLQAYLRRTEGDCRDLAGVDSRIRLCKGAYREPASVAHQATAEVDDSYRRCLAILFEGDGYPMVASHDPSMIEAAGAEARRTGRGPDRYEHQMLYGIRDVEQQRLADDGTTMRVYVPYGAQWYGYFMRRLAERPANVTFFLRSLATRN